MNMIKNKFLKISAKLEKIDFILVTASTVVCALLSFVYSVYAKKYVIPLEYGIYTTCLLLQTYLNYAQLGVMNAYNRDYPQLLGAKKTEDANTLKNTIFSFVTIIYFVLFLIIDVVIILIYRNQAFSNHYSVGYLLGPIAVLLETIASFGMYTERMEGHYNYTGVVSLLKTAIAIAVGLIAIKRWLYYGLFVVPILGSVISILFYYRSCFRRIKVKIDRAVLKVAIRTGLPLLINSLVWTVMASVDKFVILFFMTTEDLGIYSVPLMGFSTMVIIPQTISQIFYYRISKLYGETNSTDVLIEQCNKYTVLTSQLTGITVIMAFYILPIFVRLFMPNYSSGIVPAQILIMGVAIYSATMLYSNIFSVLRLNKDLLINTVALCIFNIIFSTAFVLINGRKVENVAVGTSVSYFIYSALLLIRINKRFNYSIKKLVYASWVPVVVAVVPCYVFYYLIPSVYIAMVATLLLSGGIYLGQFLVNRRKEHV